MFFGHLDLFRVSKFVLRIWLRPTAAPSTLWLKIFRPKILNYAKQTQFPKCQKCFNLSIYKELQQIMSCGLLCKTNPIKPNLSNGRAGSCHIAGVFWRTLDVLWNAFGCLWMTLDNTWQQITVIYLRANSGQKKQNQSYQHRRQAGSLPHCRNYFHSRSPSAATS